MSNRPQPAKPPAKRPASQKAGGMTVLRVGPDGLSGRYLNWYQMDFIAKINMIRTGMPAQCVSELSFFMDMPKEVLMDLLGLSRATINRKVQRTQALSSEESERVMGMQSLIGQVQTMIDPDLAPNFDAAKWLARWLAEPLPALNGATPASYMDTVEGQKYVGKLLDMAQSGAYA